MKPCPFCSENIQDRALVCRFCGRDLPRSTASSIGAPWRPAPRVSEPPREEAPFEDLKLGTPVACPFCANTVKIGHRRCRHCGADFAVGMAPSRQPPPARSVPVRRKKRSAWKPVTYAIGVIVVFGTIGSLTHSRLSTRWQLSPPASSVSEAPTLPAATPATNIQDQTTTSDSPNGAVARCRNGMYVWVATDNQTCAGLGGVAEWLPTAAAVTASASSSDATTSVVGASRAREFAENPRPPCSLDLECLGEKFLTSATVRCRGPLERLTNNGHQWTDGIVGPRFARYRWIAQSRGAITYLGDNIRFQDAAGRWQDVVYECDFDTASETVLAVRAERGRLPN